ncbi:MAG: metallophosphoesterase [Actinobacteria bacterium]|jgi:predicted phosphodiesterase|nr:MAG: metallophosphoesterase [Actinomycetota bacterium]
MIHGLISDVHANLEALRAVISELGDVDDIWFLGDAVGYGPDPQACFEEVSKSCSRTIAGNHDLGVAGVIGLGRFRYAAAVACRYSMRELSDEAKQRIGALPLTLELDDGVTLTHGSLVDPIWQYVISAAIADLSFEVADFRVLFVGHSHFPAVFVKEGEAPCVLLAFEEDKPIELGGDTRFIINPGAVGQPRDGDPRAAYAIYDDEAQTVTLRRVEYPIAETRRKMADAMLPGSLAERLSYGL